jgi:hypothetical protein
MALTLSNRVWILVERLYIYTYQTDGFLNLLRRLEIEYKGERDLLVTERLQGYVPFYE